MHEDEGKAVIPLPVRWAYPDLTTPPIITQTFTPGRGWTTAGGRLSLTAARSLARTGVTGIAVEVAPGRAADFTTTDLCRTH